MRVRAQTEDGDMRFGHAQADFLVDSPEAVAQIVETRLKLLAGEWFLDAAEGTPYNTRILGTGTRGSYDQALRQRILSTPGVRALQEYSSSVEDRALSVNVQLNTVYGTTVVQASL